jgi:CheY-like chemotaxis protein
VVEDESVIALDIADCVEAAGGRVVGPVPTVQEALTLLETAAVDAAILDGNLADRDVTPVALLLAARNVPIIVYSGLGLPGDLAASHPNIPLIKKPAPVSQVVKGLVEIFRKQLEDRPAEAAVTRPLDTRKGRDIAFGVIHVLVDDGFRIGRSAFAGGNLIGILIPVSAEEEGDDGAGGWYLEAGFGRCGGTDLATPPVFADLHRAAAWFSARMA